MAEDLCQMAERSYCLLFGQANQFAFQDNGGALPLAIPNRPSDRSAPYEVPLHR